MSEPEVTGLDYETWSRTDLTTRGLPNYVADPDFRVLIASVADSEGELTFDWVFNNIWDRGEPVGDPGDDVTIAFMTWLEGHKDLPIMAHNATFERVVTHWLFPDSDPFRFEDSAVDARLCGAESKLIVASRQLTHSHKLEEGFDLVRLFCIPNEYYPDGPTPELIQKHGHLDKWLRFIEYCEMDARGSREIRLVAKQILDQFDPLLLHREAFYERATYEMNQVGWPTDLRLVSKMKSRAWANGVIAQRQFLTETGDVINFRSPKQLKDYCESRGVKVTSLDKYHLPGVLARVKRELQELQEEIDSDLFPDLIESQLRKKQRLSEVKALLETKEEIGGSTLSKLPKVLDLVSEDGRLRDQYVHAGAGQTFRTTARGVQMQNLARLDNEIRDMETLFDFNVEWTNGDMAGQFRQIFYAGPDPEEDGEIIVGDFSSVESRALAYIAGEEWKLQVYREGKNVYEALASMFFNVPYEEVTKEQRPRGKYTELSCGYQASAMALQDFMFRLGFEISDEQALEDVSNWRAANPNIVALWETLDNVIKDAVRSNMQLAVEVGNGLIVQVTPFELESVTAEHPGALSVCVQLLLEDGSPIVTRFVHGCYFKGDKLCYHKPADRLNGKMWVKSYKHPKTGRDTLYTIYGGKLAGILTQSLCRELFFQSLMALRQRLKFVPNADIIGQFHDEVNVHWWPQQGGNTREEVEKMVEEAFSTSVLPNFPIVVDVKSAYRYIK